MPVVGGFKHALVSDGTGLTVDNSTPTDMVQGAAARAMLEHLMLYRRTKNFSMLLNRSKPLFTFSRSSQSASSLLC
jgi:hypothetical protein